MARRCAVIILGSLSRDKPGHNQENIPKNDRDREKFLEYLGKANEQFSIIIHTYCLMSNHCPKGGGANYHD